MQTEKMMMSKKAQVSEGLTWVVATIAIIIILLFSLFITSLVSGNKSPAENFFAYSFPQKSFFSYLLTTETEGKTVYSEIKEEEKLNNGNGNLALRIFKQLYEKDYPVALWLGINFEGVGLRKNEFFGSNPSSVRGGDLFQRHADYISEKVNLNDDKWLELNLMNE